MKRLILFLLLSIPTYLLAQNPASFSISPIWTLKSVYYGGAYHVAWFNGNNVYDPYKIFLRDSNLVHLSGNQTRTGQLIMQSAQVLTAPTAANDVVRLSDLPTINVLNDGFVNDGITDNTAAWNTLMQKNPNGLSIYFPTGRYRGTFQTNRNNLTITGEREPIISSDTTMLINGMVLLGTVNFGGSNVKGENIGADFGSAYANQYNNGIGGDAFTVKDPTLQTTQNNNVFINCVGLVNKVNSASHAFLGEKQNNAIFINVTGIRGYFGTVFKTTNSTIDGAHGFYNKNVGVYIKGNSYAPSTNNIIFNLTSVADPIQNSENEGLQVFNEDGVNSGNIINGVNVSGGNKGVNIIGNIGYPVTGLQISNVIINNTLIAGLETNGQVFNPIINNVTINNVASNISFQTSNQTLNATVNNILATVPDITGYSGFYLDGQVIFDNIRCVQSNNNGLLGKINIRGEVHYGQFTGTIVSDGGTFINDAWNYIKSNPQTVSGAFSFSSDLNTSHILSTATTSTGNDLFSTANYQSQVTQSDYNAGKYPAIGFTAQNTFGTAIYARGDNEIRLKGLSSFDQQFILGGKTNTEQVIVQKETPTGTASSDAGQFRAQTTNSNPAFSFLRVGQFSTNIQATGPQTFTATDNTGQTSTFYSNINQGFITDGDITSPITSATYNDANNYTATITPSNSKIFLQGQKYKEGNFLYIAISDNKPTRIPLAMGVTPVPLNEFSGNKILTISDPVQNIKYVGSGGDVLTLSAVSPSQYTNDKGFYIKNSSPNNGNLIINGKIDGVANANITLTINQSIFISPDGSGWLILSSYGF